MIESMRRDVRRVQMLIWCLGAFHAAVLLLVLVLALYLSDDLADRLDDTGTLPGLAAFAVLWFASWLGTRRMLIDGKIMVPQRFLREFRSVSYGAIGGMLSGGIVGVVIVVAVAVNGLVGSENEIESAAQVPLAIFVTIFLSSLAAFFGGLAGGLIGLLFGIIDGLLLWLALSVLGVSQIHYADPFANPPPPQED